MDGISNSNGEGGITIDSACLEQENKKATTAQVHFISVSSLHTASASASGNTSFS